MKRLLPAIALAVPIAAPAQQARRVTVAPYIEASQTLDADLDGDGGTVTYAALAAGIDAAATGRRIEAQASYRYEHRFAESRQLGDADLHTGLARISASPARGLTLEAGALATRTREDIAGAAPALLVGNDANIVQLYSGYAGPSLSTGAGDLAINAAYRIGFTKVGSPAAGLGLVPGAARRDLFDSSGGQALTASVGTSAHGPLPIGLTLSGGYQDQRASQLSQRYSDWYGRGDVLAPVAPTLALAGGVGYERLQVTQRDPLRDAGGAPVLDGAGRIVTDPASPRRIAYRTDGVYYDAGVVWRPNHRTELAAHVGRRYGSTSYTGTLSWRPSRSTAIAGDVYDSIETFGHQLQQGLAGLPTSFVVARDAYSRQFNGCVFSASGTTPGGCLNDVFQSVTTASYRARGVDLVATVQRGRSTWGAGLGYANRRLYAPDTVPGVTLIGLEDESWYGQLFWTHALSRVSGVTANLFANWYDPAGTGRGDVTSIGATASYFHDFGRLGTTATVGLYDTSQGDLRSQLSAQALLAARYTF